MNSQHFDDLRSKRCLCARLDSLSLHVWRATIPTAIELADDLERFLTDKPIQVKAPSIAELPWNMLDQFEKHLLMNDVSPQKPKCYLVTADSMK